ncbi:hypothetical protein C3747_18g148 [Trypanosoma cruzi]|uniref:Uncharacterized protein n=1 Tax=Trypanosoma cruzi TaxID=5693 RepID=A0A2V2X9M5_TRYCR|nr:hypothetical protein C3747_18g148 [Trypanosoma cruzi]
MSFNLDDLFDTGSRQQQQQQHGGPTYMPPPPPSDPPPPPVFMQQDQFGVNATALPPPPPPPPPAAAAAAQTVQPFEAVGHAPIMTAPYQTYYAPSPTPQAYGGNGYALSSPPVPSSESPSALLPQAAYYTTQTPKPVAYGSSYQTSPGAPIVSPSTVPPTLQSTAMPFVPSPSHPEPAINAPTASNSTSVFAQEEEDRKQLEKIIQLRKELEKERERERKKREELETWGCPSCTYRNSLDVNRCEMCDSNRPGYHPPPDVVSPSTIKSDTHSSSSSPLKKVAISSEVAGPTAWVCSICLAPNEAHNSRCKVCRSYQKNGKPITGGNGNPTGATSDVSMPPTAWLCGICGKKNAATAARCGDCNSYQSNGVPVVDPEPKAQIVAETVPTTWKCSVCTLENSVSAAVCEACQSGQRPRHLAPPKTNEKKKSGNEPRKNDVPKTWSCSTCTYQNAIAKEKCEMCSNERPSQYKPPLPSGAKKEAEDSGEDIQWQEDEVARECNRCHLPFNFTRRRHHCRACGFVFCGACSSFQLALKKNGPLERVCVSCYEGQK